MKISPIFYMGSKRKLITKGLIDLFPKNIKNFADVFGGSGIVSMNVEAEQYHLNDMDKNLFEFYLMFQNNSPETIIKNVLKNIEDFQMLRIGVKQNTDEATTYKERYFKMRQNANQTKSVFDLYSCLFYAFSQQMRFNSKGDFNMPFGNGAFTETNEDYIREGSKFFNQLVGLTHKVLLYNQDFKTLNFDNWCENDFVYLDPPYFNTTATYNENGGWQMQDELDLFALCEALNAKGIKWGMSNVFSNKGVENTHLIEWCEKNNWSVYTFDSHTYMACGKGNSNAKEVYICNY